MCVCRVGHSQASGSGGDAVVRRALIVTGIAIREYGLDTDLIRVRYDYRRGSWRYRIRDLLIWRFRGRLMRLLVVFSL